MTDIVLERLGLLEDYVLQLERLRAIPSRNVDQQRSLERHLHLATECILDVGEILVSRLRLPKTENYPDVILRLGEAGILPEPFAASLAPVASLRNVLVHDYARVDPRGLEGSLDRLDGFRVFARHVTEFVAKHRAGPE